MTSSYDFSGYLDARGTNWFDEDPLLRRWVARSELSAEVRSLLDRFGRDAASTWIERSDLAERREHLPRVREPDPYNRHPPTEVELPEATLRTLAEVHGSGIWRADFDERARYAVVYLLNEHGEMGVTCSVACTDGLARVLRMAADPADARAAAILREIEAATPGRWVHGAQFVTEIQGGSDAATNALEARPDGDGARLYGQKWFCSNLTADYWLVTARPTGAPAGHRGIALYCVPRRRDGAPNGYRIRRLKDKLGTRALPTAEIEFEGAWGFPVGPLDAGLRTMVAIVLTTSRVHNVVAAAASLRRALREAEAYAAFRTAFGRRLADVPLLAASLERLRTEADLAAAGAFACVEDWTAALAPDATREQKTWARILVSLAKAVATRRTSPRIYEAMMLVGGNGIEERFSVLPRLYRDAAIMETWEGPYTLLLHQALCDLDRLGVRGHEGDFLRFGLRDQAGDALVSELQAVLEERDETARALAFGELAPRLFFAYEAWARSTFA